MVRLTRWLLTALAAALLGCSPVVAVITEPGASCSKDDVAIVYGFLSPPGHTPLLADDYSGQLCEWNGDGLDARERRRMGRDTSHYDVARTWAKLGETERALAAYRRDLEGATTTAARVADHVGIALVLSEIDEHEAALHEFEACDAELKGERWGWVEDARANVLAAADRRREAIAVLEARPREDAWDMAKTQSRIAELWLKEHEPERARAAYESILKHYEGWGPDGLYDAQLGLVRVLLAERRLVEALDTLDQWLEDSPVTSYWFPYAAALRLRAEILVELDKPWSAAASVRRAFEHEYRYFGPSEIERARHRSQLASLHRKAGRSDLAYSGYEAAYRTYSKELGPLDQRTLTAAHNVGVACLDLGDPEQAVGWFRLAVTGHEASASEPDKHGFTLFQLGRAEHRSGLYAEAARSFTVALDLLGDLDDLDLTDRERARMYHDAALAFEDAGVCERALALLELASEAHASLGEDESLERPRRCRKRQASAE